MRRDFDLIRTEDVTGLSGTGRVAEGVVWEDGQVTLHWLTEHPSIATFPSLDDMLAVHGHSGRTTAAFAAEPNLLQLVAAATKFIGYNHISQFAGTGQVRVEVRTKEEWRAWLRTFSQADEPWDAAVREPRRDACEGWEWRWQDPSGSVLISYRDEEAL